MPRYDYECTSCGAIQRDVFLPIAQRQQPTETPCLGCGGTVILMPSAPGVSYGINNGGLKTPDSFKDVLRRIKSNHRRSTIEV